MKNSAVPYVSVHYGRVRALIPPRGTCAFRCAHLGGVRAHTGIREAIALQFLARITLIVQPFLRSYVRFCENGRFRSLLSIALLGERDTPGMDRSVSTEGNGAYDEKSRGIIASTLFFSASFRVTLSVLPCRNIAPYLYRLFLSYGEKLVSRFAHAFTNKIATAASDNRSYRALDFSIPTNFRYVRKRVARWSMFAPAPSIVRSANHNPANYTDNKRSNIVYSKTTMLFISTRTILQSNIFIDFIQTIPVPFNLFNRSSK